MSPTLFWSEDERPDLIQIPEDVVDLVFAIDCQSIPVDHAHLLARALQTALPWLTEESGVTPHSIHVAGSQNGWERPAHGTDSILMVSRRTRLTIRAHQTQVADLLTQLPGARLDLAGHVLTLGAGRIRPLSRETTLFARYVALDTASVAPDEQGFLDTAARLLAKMDIRVRKALCGKSTPLANPNGPVQTRSLMLASLTVEESIRLQQHGLGVHRLMGCGLFIPHKGIEAVRTD